MKQQHIFLALALLLMTIVTATEYVQASSVGSSMRVVLNERYLSCTDTDGGLAYGVKGKVYGNYSNSTHYEFTDSCNSGASLKEWYCQSTNPRYQDYNCVNMGSRYYCSDGKCVKNQTNTTKPPLPYIIQGEGISGRAIPAVIAKKAIGSCRDTDGGKVYGRFGWVYGAMPNGTQYNYSDFCWDDNRLNEWYCKDYASEHVDYNCAIAGGICSNGRCTNQTNKSIIPKTIPALSVNTGNAGKVSIPTTAAISTATVRSSCTDTDGGRNYIVKGKVLGNYSNSTHYEFTDSCNSGASLKEWYCQSTNPRYQDYNCVNMGSRYYCSDGKCVKNQTNTTKPPLPYIIQGEGISGQAISTVIAKKAIGSCRDTDGGKVYGRFGWVYGAMPNGTQYNYSDFCWDDNRLNEWYCKDYASEHVDYNCAQVKKTCNYGQCI